jgi:lipopolysaccharide export LptBFGC system permease protein LptF
VDSIDRARSELRGVTVVDMSTPNRPVYVTAEHGTVSMRPNGRDLLVELADGQLTLTRPDRPENFHTIAFEHHVSSLRDLVAGFSENAAGVVRAERELSIATLRQRIREASPESALDVARYRGELHRRYATAFACLVFVLLAAPLGRRVAAGGIGAVINLSIAVIFFFRVGIIVGDRLVDAGRVHPILGSWGTVGVLLLVALPLLLSSVLATSSRADRRGGS